MADSKVRKVVQLCRSMVIALMVDFHITITTVVGRLVIVSLDPQSESAHLTPSNNHGYLCGFLKLP